MCVIAMSERLIVALDVSSSDAAIEIVQAIGPALSYVKVGMELFYSAGPDLIRILKDQGLQIFLDLKMHDIPNTVFHAVQAVSKLGCDMINVHCAGGFEMLRRARQAIQDDTKLIGVTQLTSGNQQVMNEEIGIPGSVLDSVLHYASMAKEAGLHGVVCSSWEVAEIRSKFGSEFLTVTPGIRPAGYGTQDQKRVMTPKEAMLAGSNYLVMGRAIIGADSPRIAFEGILKELAVIA